METVSPQYAQQMMSPERRPYEDDDYLSPDATLLMPGDIPSPPRKDPTHYRAVNTLFEMLFRLDDKMQEYRDNLETSDELVPIDNEYAEVLDGIAQNLIDLNLGISTDLLIQTRQVFNERWEELDGNYYDNFMMLYDCCCDILSRYLHPIPDLV
jgi:hypothetical protein